MSEQKSFWQKLWELVIQLFQSSTKTPNYSESQKNNSDSSSDQVKSELKQIARDFIEQKAVQLGSDYISMLKSLSPKQKDFVMKMSIIKSIDKSELTLEETLELGDMLNEAARLNLEITDEMSSFWSKFGDITSEVVGKFAEVGIRVAAKTLMSYIPIPL